MRCGRVEGQRIAFHQLQRLESDDRFELSFDDVKVFATVVTEGPSVFGRLAAGLVHDLDEVDPVVVGRREALPPHARRELDGVAIAGPLYDARPICASRATPW